MTTRELLEVAEGLTNVDIYDEDGHYVTSGFAESIRESTAPIFDRKVDTFELLIKYDCPVMYINLAAKEDV